MLILSNLKWKPRLITLIRKGEGGLDANAISLTNPDGGYLVPRDTSGRIVMKVQDYSLDAPFHASVQMISGDALEGLKW